MFVASAGRMCRRGAILALVAGGAASGQILSLALARAESVMPSIVMIEPAPTAIGVARPTRKARRSGRERARARRQSAVVAAAEFVVGHARASDLLAFTASTAAARGCGALCSAAESTAAGTGPPEPDHPLLTLLGALAGDGQGVGIFLNETDKTTLRLRTGEDHQGWVLTSIRGGAATFVKGERTATLTLLPIGSAAQTHASSIALGNTWRDGDGQMIHAPREPKPASPVATPSRNTWLDGDGQTIGAPPKNRSSLPQSPRPRSIR